MKLDDDAPFYGVVLGAAIVIAVFAICMFLSGCSTPCDQHWRCFGAACGSGCAN